MSTIVVEGGVKPVSKGLNIALWVLQVLVGLAMIAAGVMKLIGAPMMVEEFETIGLGQWFRYLTGGWEVIAGVLLLVPKLSGVGATVLIPVMAGAVIAHLTKLGGSPVAPLVFLAMVSVIAWGRRRQTLSLMGL
jgi:putative oxidoreductase